MCSPIWLRALRASVVSLFSGTSPQRSGPAALGVAAVFVGLFCAGCGTTNADAREALLVVANSVGKARCGGPLARNAEAEIVERRGDDRFGGGRAIIRGSTADGVACSAEVPFSYLRPDTPIGLFTGRLTVQNLLVGGSPADAAPASGPQLALGVPRRGEVTSAEGDLFGVDLEVGRAVTFLLRGQEPLALGISYRSQELELSPLPVRGAPFFVPPTTGHYVLRVRGPRGTPYVVAVLPGGMAGPVDGWVPVSQP